MNEYRYIGPPGTGKTTAITHQLALEAEHYGGENVVALSHTRAAAKEIAGRDKALPDTNIGTLHAMAYRALGRPDVADEPKRMAEFAADYPHWVTDARSNADPWDSNTPEEPAFLREYSRLRSLMIPRSHWPQPIVTFAADWEKWKTERSLIDYTDMIELALRGFPTMPGKPVTIVCDEMQDLSRLQYALLCQWGEHAHRVITAGDQDQCIYQFSGADPTIFTANRPVAQKVLAQSWRVPKSVHEAAVAWIEQIEDREPITYNPRDYVGYLSPCTATWQFPQDIVPTLLEHITNGATVMVMASCTYMLKPLITELRTHAIPYGNPWAPEAPGGCNPLGTVTTRPKIIQGILAFARHAIDPYSGHPSAGLWTASDLQVWSPLLKGVFARGGRTQIDALPPDTPVLQVYELLAKLMTPDALAVLRKPEPNWQWFREHLTAQIAGQMVTPYAFAILERHGIKALTDPPRLYIGTIHSFKGAEADHAILMPDLSRAGMSAYTGPDRASVVRQFYVGMTRAKLGLTICAPSGRWSISHQ